MLYANMANMANMAIMANMANMANPTDTVLPDVTVRFKTNTRLQQTRLTVPGHKDKKNKQKN